METQNLQTKYLIKDGIIYNSQTLKHQLFIKIEKIDIPQESKNILTNNKILLIQLKKIKNQKEKEIELSIEIENFLEIKKKIEQIKKSNSKKFIKPKDDDYNFIEKTSQIEIIDGIINNIDDKEFIELENQLNKYIKNNTSIENEKKVELEEEIDIQKEKINKISDERQKYISTDISPLYKREKDIEIKIKQIKDKNEKLINKLNEIKENKKNQIQIENITKDINKIKHINQDIELEIKILTSKSTNLKEKIRFGEIKTINWPSFILTLGLIYWTRYSDNRYKLSKINTKIHSKKEKILINERKKFNLEKKLNDIIEKRKKDNLENNKKEEETYKEIEDSKIDIKEQEKSIEKIKKIIEEKEKELKNYDLENKKIGSKLTDLIAILEELEKYSITEIKKELDEIKQKKQEDITQIKMLKENIQKQKTSIKGEWIIEI